MSTNTWLKRGAEAERAAKEYDEEIAKKARMPRRLWLAPNSSKRIVFLDSESIYVLEHTLPSGGKWNDFETCYSSMPKPPEECPICIDGRYPASAVLAYTVLDIGRYPKKRGGMLINPKQILVVKSTVKDVVLRRIRQMDGDLTGCVFEVYRGNQKDNSTGSDFQFIERLSREDLVKLVPEGQDPEEYLKPVDYERAFAISQPEVLRRKLNMKDPVGHGDAPYTGPEQDDDDVPFDRGGTVPEQTRKGNDSPKEKSLKGLL